jgi:hypothetical protein
MQRAGRGGPCGLLQPAPLPQNADAIQLSIDLFRRLDLCYPEEKLVGNSISWWRVVEIVGLAAVPFAFPFFRSLADRGYAFSKPAGILLFTYMVWLGGSLHLFAARVPALLVLFSCLGEPVFSSPSVTAYRVSEGGAMSSCPVATH